MIRMHADAVLHVRDGLTGRAVESGGLLCSLDGLPYKPVHKLGGGLVLINLLEGPHSLTIACPGFQNEQVDLEAAPGVTQELYVALKPSDRYPFLGEITRLFLTVMEKKQPAAGRILWLCAPGAPECKLAQTRAEPGTMELRLFWKGTAARLIVPGEFLLEDGSDTEIVTIESLNGETGVLASPLVKGHNRGKLLFPAQRFRADGAGTISAVFRTAGPVAYYCPQTGKSGWIELAAGENRHTLSL